MKPNGARRPRRKSAKADLAKHAAPPALQPARSPRRILIIGPGRLGGALARSLKQAGHAVAVAARPKPGKPRRDAPLFISKPFSPSEADVLFLTVPDQAIASVAQALSPQVRRGQIVAHCAGSQGLDVLAPAAERGAHAGSLHPLCAVPSPTASLRGAFAAIEGDTKASRTLSGLARDLGLAPFALAPGRRSLYHAAAAMASNGLVALADEASALLLECGVRRSMALGALLPLMRSALAGLEREGLPRALTGPIARGDAAVVRAHVEAVAKVSSSTAFPLYRALAASLVRLSRQLGQAREEDLAQVLSALAGNRRA